MLQYDLDADSDSDSDSDSESSMLCAHSMLKVDGENKRFLDDYMPSPTHVALRATSSNDNIFLMTKNLQMTE